MGILPAGRLRRRRCYTMILAISAFVLFFVPFYVIYKPPNALIRYFQHRWPDVLWHVPLPKDHKVIALTIDDAPSQYTPDIVETLEEHNAHATFFIIGSQAQGRGDGDVLRDAVRRGHELANHAMHDEPSRLLKAETLASQVLEIETFINATYTGVGLSHPPRYFRPGSGFFSTSMRETIRRLGYQLVLGSVYPHDAQIQYPRVNAKHVLSMVRPGSIVVCHDRRQWTVPMLKIVLPELKKQGYRVATISELAKVGKQAGKSTKAK